MIDSARERDPIEELVDEFASRLRDGETPSISEYVRRYPQHAEEIEMLLPTVAAMEQYRSGEQARRRKEFLSGQSSVPEHLGDFRIIGEIGRGGMGIVYEAEQKSLARRVALKVLPKHALLLEKDRRRFEREAQTAANLHHTHIVPVFGTGEHDGLHYYVMPLVRGVGLDEVISKLRDRRESGDLGPEHWTRVARIGIQAAEALDYAHRQGTLHRDIKPSNLLLDENDNLAVADFGLARAMHSTDGAASGEVVGTPRYVAPEQLRGEAEVRSDLYSLGVTLYELATLQPAFEDSTGRLEDVVGRGRAEPVPPRRVNPSIPRDLQTIVLKCLQCEPHRRYQSAAELADDLQRFLDRRPIRARHVTWIERAARWCRRNPALASVSAIAAALLVAVAVVGIAGHLQTRQAYRETSAALERAEATSMVALEALDDIYLQLSPDRIWIQSGVDARGEVCVCLGLKSGAGPERAAMQLHASEETAALLQGLLVCYDRLAEQVGARPEVRLQSAIACRRLGDIRQLLGQLAEAEEEYGRAVEKLTALKAAGKMPKNVALELARTYNGLGNARSEKLDTPAAYASHREALFVLRKAGPVANLPEEHRYETARTLYFLANKSMFELRNRRGEASSEQSAQTIRPYSGRQCRKAATRLLEQLIQEDPHVPDYRFLLALCLRPAGTAAMTRAEAKDRQRAITILEELKTEHPDVLEYRYELAATYAWLHVGFFPWQAPIAEPHAKSSLGMALAESRWLMNHNPSIPQYACATALILAKLGEVHDRAGAPAKAESLLCRALQCQEAAVERFPALPPHHQVLSEFIRLKLAQVILRGHEPSHHRENLRQSRDLLNASIAALEQLAQHPELAEDRLAGAAIPIAYETLAQVLAELDEQTDPPLN